MSRQLLVKMGGVWYSSMALEVKASLAGVLARRENAMVFGKITANKFAGKLR